MRHIASMLLALLLAACAQAQTYSGVSLGGGSGGGGSANIAVTADCRSFGTTTTATEGSPGTLNIKYGDPVHCHASATTVSGTRVNGEGATGAGTDWTPEAFFAWDWDDSSLGTVSVANNTVDLGKSVGVVAAHQYLPSAFSETCNSGTNSLHAATLTVYAMVGGVRESDSVTLNVCVEDPATTWPTPIAYCDDADCSNDSFTGVVNPGTPSHGGNGTDLATIMRKCETDGASRRILVEGGVTFATSSGDQTIGNQGCLVESYGGSKATLDFNGGTNPHLNLTNTCGGYVIHNVNLSGSDTSGVGLVGNNAGDKCFALSTVTVASSVGSRMGGLIQAVANDDMEDIYFFKVTYDAHFGALNAVFLQVKYFAFVGGLISATGEHDIRLPNWRYVVIDANTLLPQVLDKHILAMRQECGATSPPCTDEASSHTAAITRNYMFGAEDGAGPVEFRHDGNSHTQVTENYDVDLIQNLFAKEVDADNSPDMWITDDGPAGSIVRRFRIVQNAMDASESNNSRLFVLVDGTLSDLYVAGNVMWQDGATSSGTGTISDFNYGVLGGTSVVVNNVLYETTGGTGDVLENYTESSDNKSLTSDPWDADGAAPGRDSSFDWPDVKITSSNTALKGQGALTAYPTDFEGETCTTNDAGADCE